MAFTSTIVTFAAPSSFFRSHLRSCLPPPPSSPSSPPSLPASPLTRSHRLPPLVLPPFGNGSSDPPSASPPPSLPTTPLQPPAPLPCSLSHSLLLDPPSTSLHYVFHRRSPPRSHPLSTVGRLPLHCTPISATMIVTNPASPLPSPGVVAIFRPRRPPASPSSSPLPLFLATALASLPRPPLSSTTIAALRPSTPVTKTERHRRCHHRCLCSPSFSSHRLRPCLPAAVSLLPPPTVRVQATLPLLFPASIAVSCRCRHRHELPSVAVPHPCQLRGKALSFPYFHWSGWVRKEMGHGFLG